jgi:chemotaxis protein methyltransferase CheR
MNLTEIEQIEIDLVLRALQERYGYDFTHYARASLTRRIRNFLVQTQFQRISQLIPGLLYDANCIEAFLGGLSVSVTEMFRDPQVYRKIRTEVIPYLKTFPHVRIWHAGCATGEEVYSLAILLAEEGLYDRCQIYATDFNETSLKKAQAGIFPLEPIRHYTANYQKSGGTRSFAEFYHSEYDGVIMSREIKRNITFANHNLAMDASFGEMHLIFCRNVLIYFDAILQNRVLQLLRQSLIMNGFLCLGTKEGLRFSEVESSFVPIAAEERIYKKIQ